MSESKDTVTMSWTGEVGRYRTPVEQTREVNQTVDARDFLGTAVYPWLIIAANLHLSAGDVQRWLALQAGETPGTARTLNWIKKRRWMCQKGGTSNVGNLDGQDSVAIEFMADNPKLSLRALAFQLREHGISRSVEWLRKRRVSGMECQRRSI